MIMVRVLSRYAQIDAGAVELRLIRPDKDGKQAFLIHSRPFLVLRADIWTVHDEE